MNLSEYDISNPYPATLVETERITPEDSAVEVRHLVFELPDGDFHFVEGQSIGVLVPGPHEFGNQHHLRLYSIASTRKGEKGKRNTVSICVRRCFYIDEVSGESYPGKASNYLCDSRPGDAVEITGPYGAHFQVPQDRKSNLLMVGVGTGIAPFRAFIRSIYEDRGGWEGLVRLFYGAKSGTELLYMNDKVKDFTLYYDEKTFKAFEAVSPRPAFDLPPDLDRLLMENRNEVWSLMQEKQTYVYLAGLHDAAEKFEKAMIAMAGGEDAWRRTRTELVAQGRYSELLY